MPSYQVVLLPPEGDGGVGSRTLFPLNLKVLLTTVGVNLAFGEEVGTGASDDEGTPADPVLRELGGVLRGDGGDCECWSWGEGVPEGFNLRHLLARARHRQMEKPYGIHGYVS